MIIKERYGLLFLIVTTLLSACSMGGGETGTGYDKEHTTQGVITGFGSVFVNGVKYETNKTKVLVDDTESTESFLKVGMVVTLDGLVDVDTNRGLATKIQFDRDVEGEVLENNIALNGTLDVLGQTVHIDIDTIFESQVVDVTQIELVAPGNLVEVSGFSDGSGEIYATRVEVKQAVSASQSMEIKGEIKNLNGLQFEIGSLTIDASTAKFDDNMTQADLANGLLVKVESNQALVNGVLVASEVKRKEKFIKRAQPDVEEDEEVEIEGVVTQIIDDSTFFVNGQRVSVDISVVELEDITLNDITIGTRLKIEGVIDTNGLITATEIKGKKQSNSKLEGRITSINTTNQTFIVNGIEVMVTAETRLKDDADDSDENERRYFNFNNLAIGDKVEFSFYTDSTTGMNIVTKLEREVKEISSEDENSDESSSDEVDEGDSSDDSIDDDSDSSSSGNEDESEEQDDQWERNGIVTQLDIDNQTFVIEGVTIDYSMAEDFDGFAEGDEVEVDGIIQNGIWLAMEIDVKD